MILFLFDTAADEVITLLSQFFSEESFRSTWDCQTIVHQNCVDVLLSLPIMPVVTIPCILRNINNETILQLGARIEDFTMMMLKVEAHKKLSFDRWRHWFESFALRFKLRDIGDKTVLFSC